MKCHWLLVLALLIAAFGGWSWWRDRPIERPAGVLAPDVPLQTDLDGSQTWLHVGDATLQPLAKFSLTARVLSRDDYHFDPGSVLSPTDLALGWGRMSDSAVLRDIDINQGARFYTWRVSHFPIPRREIEQSSANMHMIPANRAVARELGKVRAGDVVTLDGLLVEADRADRAGGWRWRSSLTRDDTGNGACELVYVQQLSIGAR